MDLSEGGGSVLAPALPFRLSWKAGSPACWVRDTWQLRKLILPGLTFASCQNGTVNCAIHGLSDRMNENL